MSSIFAFALITHVVMGVIGVIASYAVLLLLLKREAPVKSAIVWSALAFVSYSLSWLSGGYYYVFYYGDLVKPEIISGMFPWAHKVVMEAKEHLFLALPFATLALFLALIVKRDVINSSPDLKSALLHAAIAITIIATVVTLSGVIISGSAR